MAEETLTQSNASSFLTVKQLADKYEVEKYTIQYVLKALKIENDAVDENNNNAHLYGKESQQKIDDYMVTKYRGGKERQEDDNQDQDFDDLQNVQDNYINTLLDQIDEKDRQIRSKDEQLSNLDERQKNLLSLIAMEKNETKQLEEENQRLEEKNKELQALVEDTQAQEKDEADQQALADQESSIDEIKELLAQNQAELKAMEDRLNDYQNAQASVASSESMPQQKPAGLFSRMFGRK